MISVEEKLIPSDIIFKKNYNLQKLLNDIGNPQNNFKVINTVGTNGKGSTSNFIFNGLKTKFKNVGLFISPAFINQNERIQLNSEMISDEDLKRLLNENNEVIKKYELTFFEIWTLLAILYFNEKKVEVAVIEAGIGGVKDSTNVFENQLAVCVTSLGLDHQEVLGNTIEQIAYQKLGIAKKGVKIFISADNIKYKKIINKVNNNYKVFAKKIPDKVYYQSFNKGLAKEVLNYLGIIYEEFNTTPLGRFSILKKEPLLILDGCHNYDGALKLSKQIKKIKNLIIVFGSSEGKDQKSILEVFKKLKKEIFITEFNHPKAWKIDHSKFADYKIINDWEKFLKDNQERNILVCGSLYFIPQVYEWFKGK
ncbi:folylpolyglutamate synthase/dihydrofolate synthase family protein [Spiroplasma sp. BIUS-1]|uniref:bifunctional folylpolyglutamate synthase/dihydrofolate synthase n=1 Tax=Spiroplasma sp. BIUS-1 TaxID=216964 RepID=UPI0013981511|nr:Mur ligase family protein [Spiroplasma sp. BIUS-1]QHX36315.1 folylpolyglutamate synthase [Spiroplasma sp. BIUS-1]